MRNTNRATIVSYHTHFVDIYIYTYYISILLLHITYIALVLIRFRVSLSHRRIHTTQSNVANKHTHSYYYRLYHLLYIYICIETMYVHGVYSEFVSRRTYTAQVRVILFFCVIYLRRRRSSVPGSIHTM